MSRVQAVIADFGGVLTSPLLDSFVGAVESSGISLEELGNAMAQITERDGVNPLFELETGRMTEPAFLDRLAAELSARRGSPVELDGFGELYFRYLKPNEPVIAYMRELRGRGYKLAICTNNVREWEGRWRAMLPVDEIFDVVVDSAFVGTRKPDPEIYRITLERLGAAPGATVFLDDVNVNCDGARRLGMIAIQFRSSDQAIAEIESTLPSVTPESLQAILAIAHNGFVSLDGEGRVIEWNARAAELFGYSREEAIGAELAELIIPERYRALHRAGLRRAAAQGSGPSRRLIVDALRRDGSEFPVEVSIAAVRDANAAVFHAWIQDVSERAQVREFEAQLRGVRPGFAEILDVLAEAVTIRDPHNHILYANRAALRHMSFASLEEMQRQPPQAIFADYVVHDEHGGEVTMEQIPSVRLLAGQDADPLVIRTIHRTTGELRWQLLKAAPIHDDEDRPMASVMIIEDVTRERIAELRDRFMARASETLMSSIDYEETLRNVTWLAVPEIADWCAVELVDERGTRQQLAVAHRDPAKLELAERLRRFEPERLDPQRGVGKVLRTGSSVLYQQIPDEALVKAAVNDEHLGLLRAVGFRSVLLAPLKARGRAFGVMTLVNAESMRRFDDDDREFAEQVAARAAVAVDNARLATARRQTASTLQKSLLPDVVPPIEGWRVATLYRSARVADEVEVGGDFYDFYESGEDWIVLLGDVTGKGAEAATLTSLVRHGARFLTRYERSPSRILAGLNDALREQPGLWLCTALCVRLGEEAVIASAGHPAPLVVRDDGRLREIGAAGPILGAWADSGSTDRPVLIAPDETLFLYTDGVIDARGEHERFGVRRLKRTLCEHAGRPPKQLLSCLEDDFERFQVGSPADDTAALALRPAGRESVAAAVPAQPAGQARTLPMS